MSIAKFKIKKLALIISLFTSCMTSVYAQDAGGVGIGGDSILLSQIRDYTKSTMESASAIFQKVENLPTFIAAMTRMALEWTNEDKTPETKALQGAFIAYMKQNGESIAEREPLATQLTSDFFGSNVTAESLPNANDLSYQSLFGKPYFTPDPRESDTNKVNIAYNYLKNVSAINVSHVIPSPSWNGKPADKIRYTNFYNSISAVQTFNGALFSQLYADISKGVPAAQTTLVAQATNDDWFVNVRSAEIGTVLRQILLYISQSYVLQTQQLQTEKQILSAIAANNTLLILSGLSSEGLLVNKAVTP